MANIRSLICLLTGHVDHGKSKIIESISNKKIIDKEAGSITQSIYAVNVPMKNIEKITGNLLEKIKLKIPGFLLIDSPGHAAFSNLRKRGGSIADIAIVVIDINEGIMPQTQEAIEILKNHKTPFIIALNKIDLISGWRSDDQVGILESIEGQGENTKTYLDTKLYEIVGKLYELGFNGERFDRISDYTKQVGIIPISAKQKEGMPELLMVLSGLAQKYLEENLAIETNKPGRGVVLEVKEDKGVVLDAIVYDGTLNVNDEIVIGGLDDVIVTKIRGLRVDKKNVKKVEAAASINILAPNIKEVISGMPFRVLDSEKNLEKIKKELKEEIQEVIIETEQNGIIIKANSLGSLEALITILKEKDVKIKKATIGEINKKDIATAEAEEDLNQVILGFNIKKVKNDNVKVITSEVIYKIVEDYEKWVEGKKKGIEEDKLQNLVKPCKIRIIPGYVFRQKNPAVLGTEVLEGMLEKGMPMMDSDGKKLTEIKSIQNDGKNVETAKKDEQVAVAFSGVTFGRQINENDVLITDFTENEFKKLRDFKEYLTTEETELMKEILAIKRKEDDMWGV